MAIIKKQKNVSEALNDSVIEQSKTVTSIDSRTTAIIKTIEWPSFGTACKYALQSLTASIVIGAVLYGYGAAISSLIAMLLK